MPKSFEEIKERMVADTRVAGRKTYNPVIVALVGVSGVGNSTIASALHKRLGWPVVEKNNIRVMLRQKGRGFTPQKTNEIFYAMLEKILAGGGSAILDTDFVQREARRKLEKFARECHVRIVYLRLVCEEDVTLERIVHSHHDPKTDIFPSTAVALREHMRRLLWHYSWSESKGGKLTLRRLPVKFMAEIDTEKSAVWQKKVRVAADRLKRM